MSASLVNPGVSVLMTVYNGQRYLASAIESVLSQTFVDFEFLIVDDGSTDDSLRILAEFAKRDPRIRIFTQANQGLTKSLNTGIGMVRGRYLARMDADDLSLPARFEKQVKFLEEHPDHVLVGCRCTLIDPNGYPICEKRDIVPDHDTIDDLLMKMSWPLVHPAVMMRTEAVRRIGGYDDRYRTNQDHDLFLRLAEVGKLANIQDILLQYRQHFESVGFTKVESQSSAVLQIAQAAHERRRLPFSVPSQKTITILKPMDHRRNWLWWALAAGNVATARHHAFALLRARPVSVESWRAMYCALRGR